MELKSEPTKDSDGFIENWVHRRRKSTNVKRYADCFPRQGETWKAKGEKTKTAPIDGVIALWEFVNRLRTGDVSFVGCNTVAQMHFI